jgi:hypothetical protein
LEDKWFVVNLLFKSVKSGQQNVLPELEQAEQKQEEVYEERHYLIKAKDQKNAQLIGNNLGSKAEHSYQNIYGEQVFWKCEKLIECFEVIDEIEEGAEVYSRYIICPKGTTTSEMIKRYFPEE